MVKASVSQTEDSRFESECDHQGENMITLILLTILVLIAEVFLFCCAVILCLLPIIGLCKLIEWIIDR